MIQRLTTTVLVLLSVLLTTACSDSPTDAPGDDSMTRFSFTYSGAFSSNFQANSAPPTNTQTLQSYAVALVPAASEGHDYLAMIAVSMKSASRADAMMLMLSSYSIGTYQISGDCTPMDHGCGAGFVALDLAPDDDWTAHHRYFEIEAGTVSIATSTSTRITGTFTGTAYAVDTQTGLRDPSQTLTISNGSFDMPLVDSSTFNY